MYEGPASNPAGLDSIGLFAWLFIFALYFYFAYSQFKIAQKCGQSDSAWWSFVPILNTVLLIKMANRPMWWFFALLVPLVNIVLFAMLWIDVAKSVGKAGFWGFCVLLPFINFVAIGIMAYGSDAAPSSFPPEESSKPRQPESVG